MKRSPESTILDESRGKRMLVVASTGGHLTQAVRWSERFQWANDTTFVTFDNSQSRSLLDGREQFFVPYVPPRGRKEIVQAAAMMQKIDARSHFAIASTGAGLALAALPLAARSRKPMIYIESMSRFLGPSLTGKTLARIPGIHRFCQYDGYGSKWDQVEPLLGDYTAHDVANMARTTRRVFVTLGTIKPYRFDRLIDLVLSAIRPGDEVVWQYGITDRSDLPGVASSQMSASAFSEAVSWADVVVSHAGVGSLLSILDSGKYPVTLARSATWNEHIDDHQAQIRDRLVQADLAIDLAVDPHLALTTASAMRIRNTRETFA
jgi:UDP-N-acetylglucosamine--N-acetylmuramyl-(pentapeptide) pyrophosphoryl-undecaprenol N-acetylglucosamine transferase